MIAFFARYYFSMMIALATKILKKENLMS